jgi:intein/homing endonuclease
MLEFAEKKFDGVIQLAPFGCLVGDTNITIEGYLPKPIKDIKIGDKVLTHKGRFKKVIQTFCRNYKGKILKIDCGGKLNVLITPEHPVLLAKTSVKMGWKKEIQRFNFCPAIEAKIGDFIAMPIPKEIKNVDHFKWEKKYNKNPKWEDIKKFPYSSELLRVLGYWLAEGSIHYDYNKNKKYVRGIAFHFANSEKEYINEIVKIIKKNFKTKISYYYRADRKNIMELYIGNRNLGEIILSLCGNYCDKKILHKDLTNIEPNLQKEILKGFFRGDGCFIDKYGETTYRAVTTSWNLANQLFWFLVRNRIKTSFIEQHIKNRKPSWVLKISNAEGIKRLNDEKLKVTKRKNYVRFRELENYFLVPIRKIEFNNFRGKVYNLEVEKDHSYVANFLVVHNCMPESSVRPILQKISQDKNLPFLSLSLDEQTGEAGLQTRLEAFVDMLKMKKRSF